jgi:hypothetical protein
LICWFHFSWVFPSCTGFIDILSIFSLYHFVHIAFFRCYLLFLLLGAYGDQKTFSPLYMLHHYFLSLWGFLFHYTFFTKYFSLLPSIS